jgi:hypothetical protein
MTAPFKTWTVLPHGALTAVGDKILTVVGDIHMPLGAFPRRMTVVKLRGDRLVIYSAISLDESEMKQIEAFGAPAFLIVPSERHRLDAPAWKARYPNLTVLAASGVLEKVADVVAVDATTADFGDPDVRLIEVPGTEGHELALEVAGPDGVTLVVNEVIGDIHGVHGLKGWLLERMGFAGDEPQVPAGAKMQFSKSLDQLAAQFRRWSEIPNLKRIMVSHGDIIESDPRGVLNHLADSLT